MPETKKISLPQTAEELEAMSAEEIDALIAELRRQQRESSPVKLLRRRGWGIWGDAFAGGLDGGCKNLHKELGIPDIDEDGFAADAANIRGDFERVGRDMWLGVLLHAKSEKNG